jgi:isopenicillin N synthase-like dioxygenase
MINTSTTKNLSKLIKIEYKDLINHKADLNQAIQDAFGSEGLGLIVIKNTGISELRKNILSSGFKLGHLDPEYLKKLEKPELNYNLGWSRGKSYVENQYEYLSGAFYARILCESLQHEEDPEMEKKYTNVWPDEELIPNFKRDFKAIGKALLDSQINLLKHIDKYIKSIMPDYQEDMLYNTFSEKNDCLGRLIVYYPPSSIDDKLRKEISEDNWCGWHRDFGLITALSHALYFNRDGEIISGVKSGLLVKDRQGNINDIRFEEDEIAIQAGDVLYLLSGGSIISTPHSVKIREGIPKDSCRVTYVNFFEPRYAYKINTPNGISEKDVFKNDPFNMEDTYTKFKQGCSYQDFILSALETYFPKK